VTDRPADGPQVAHQGVRDLRRSLGQDRAAPLEAGVALDVDMAREGADSEAAALVLDTFQAGQAAEVDHQLGRREAQLEERDQALPARHHLGLIAVLGEHGQSFLE